MQFKGNTVHRRRASELVWSQWCKVSAEKPQLQEFAEAWAALMEQLARDRHAQVRTMAMVTLRAIKREMPHLTDQDVREALMVLCQVWYLGTSLRNWAVERGGLL